MKNALLTMIGLAALSIPALAQQKPTIVPTDAGVAPQVEVPEGAFEVAIPNLGTAGSESADHEIVWIESENAENVVRVIVVGDGDSVSIESLGEGDRARLGRDAIVWRGPVARALPDRPLLRRVERVVIVGDAPKVDEIEAITTKGKTLIQIVRKHPATKKVAPTETVETAVVEALPTPELARPEPELPSAVELLESANAGYALSSAAPNPVSSSTQISFTLPRGGATRLEVFDNAGRVVATLADETLDAGTHTRTFDAGSLPAGLYLYRLSSGSFAETKTMTVVR